MDELFKLNFITEINYIRLFISLSLLFLCSKVIEYVYNRFGYSNDNKILFSNGMFPFLISMFLIVSVIKTSIALSLGLVGALSIIRFRTSIKEVGQLIIFFILTALSISMAAEKELLGIIVTIIYSLNTIINYKKIKNIESSSKKYLRVSIHNDYKHSLNEILTIKGFDRFAKL